MVGRLIRTLVTYALYILVLIFIGIPCLILVFLPERWRYDNKLFFWFSHLFYVGVIKASLIPVTFIGKENIPNEPVIIAANHQSSFDIPLVGACLNSFPHIWLAKSELARTWIAPILRRMAVLIDMSTPQRGLRSFRRAVNLVKGKRRHVIIFPEGGRYIGGNDVREFFSGFAMLAKQTDRPVVPIMIFDAYKVYPPDTFFVYWHPVTVVIGKPFHLLQGEQTDEFKDRVYKWFTDQVKKAEQ